MHSDELENFQSEFINSWAGKELKSARNVRPSFKYGLKLGMILTGIDQILLRGKAPLDVKTRGARPSFFKKKNKVKKIDYPKPDGKVSFDRLTNVSFSSTYHEENQPVHLKILNKNIPIETNLAYL